jgi:hypothetical protein
MGGSACPVLFLGRGYMGAVDKPESVEEEVIVEELEAPAGA